MRILQLTSHLRIGGVPSYVTSLAGALRHRGHQVIVASSPGALLARLEAAGIAHWPVPLDTSAELSGPVMASARALSGWLRREPVDLFHAHTRVSQCAAAWLSRTHRIPYVTTWHGFFRPKLSRWLWPCTGAVTIAISRPVQWHLRHAFHVPVARIRLIHNGVDVAHFSQSPEAADVQAYRARWEVPADGAPTIGGIGRLASSNVKGFDLLLNAMQLLRVEFPTLRLLIVGDGPGRPCVERDAARFGLQQQVRFTGSHADVRIPLQVMDVFAFPVRSQEGFGLSLIEAMAAGKPVMGTRVGAVPEIIEHDRSGWLVDPEDPAGLAQGIARVLREPALAARYAQAAQARVREAFSLEQMTDQIEAVYRDVLSHAVPRP